MMYNLGIFLIQKEFEREYDYSKGVLLRCLRECDFKVIRFRLLETNRAIKEVRRSFRKDMESTIFLVEEGFLSKKESVQLMRRRLKIHKQDLYNELILLSVDLITVPRDEVIVN